MRLFTHSDGFIFSFGFNMQERRPDAHRICWCDPSSLSWNVSLNSLAGGIEVPFIVAPQFIHELHDQIIAYQTDGMLVLTRREPPYIWDYARYTPEEFQGLRVA